MVEPQTGRAGSACAAHTHVAPTHEIKFTSLDLKAVEVDGSFEGYASLFHREDLSPRRGAARRLRRQPGAARRERHQDAVPARTRTRP